MRIIQRIVLYLFAVAVIAAGALLFQYELHELYAEVAARVPENMVLRYGVAVAAVVLGVFTMLPFGLFHRKGRSISFSGINGGVVIELDSFEESLRKTIAKLPMVKRVHVNVMPRDNDRKVGIEATVSLKKPADISTRETAERLREFIDKAARGILGADEVTTIDIKVTNIDIDPSQTAESLNSVFERYESAPAPVSESRPAHVATPVTAAPVESGSFRPTASSAAPYAAAAGATVAAASEAGSTSIEPEPAPAYAPESGTAIRDDDAWEAKSSENDRERDLLTYEEAEAYHHTIAPHETPDETSAVASDTEEPDERLDAQSTFGAVGEGAAEDEAKLKRLRDLDDEPGH